MIGAPSGTRPQASSQTRKGEAGSAGDALLIFGGDLRVQRPEPARAPVVEHVVQDGEMRMPAARHVDQRGAVREPAMRHHEENVIALAGQLEG